LFGTIAKPSDIVELQFFLAQYGVSISETMALAFFEFEVLTNLALAVEQRKAESMEIDKPHLA
jgi:hypothetical protein